MTISVTDFDASLELDKSVDYTIGILDSLDKISLESKLSKIPNRVMFWFDDIEGDINGFIAPTKQHIENILLIFNEKQLKNSRKNIVVHCRAGISRSTAVAIGLLIIRGKTIEQAFKIIHTQRIEMWPNALILKHFDDILNLNGMLIKHDKVWKAAHRFRFNIPEDWKDDV